MGIFLHFPVWFHIGECLSVIEAERQRRCDVTQSPTSLHLSFCPLVLDYPRSLLSHSDWQLKIIAFIMCGDSFQAVLCSGLMREQKMSSPLSLFIFCIWEINENSAVSSLL